MSRPASAVALWCSNTSMPTRMPSRECGTTTGFASAMRRPFSIQAFIVTPEGSTWSVLLLQRVARPELALPDFWQGISGALEPGESFESAAIREIQEETAIQIPAVASAEYEQHFPIKPEWRHSYGPEPTHVHEKVFFGVVTSKHTPSLSPEHKAFRWCGESEALELLTFGNNRRCVQAVFQALRSTDA